jgi:hypothetical protein
MFPNGLIGVMSSAWTWLQVALATTRLSGYALSVGSEASVSVQTTVLLLQEWPY